MVKLDPLKAHAEPRELKVNDLVIRDVLVGDVWLCSGQSNMAMTANGQGARASRPSFGKGVGRAGPNTLAIKLHAYSGASGIAGGAFCVVP